MEELMSEGMHNAKHALLSGCSAGGLSWIIHCDEFRALFSASTKVKCLADAGLFLDVVDIAGAHALRSMFEGVVTWQPSGCRRNSFCSKKKLRLLLVGDVASFGSSHASLLDINSGLASRWVTSTTRALFFPLSLPSSSPTFTLELLREFWRLAGARGKAVVRVVAADRAGNDRLERGVRGTFLGFRHDSRFFGIGYPRFFVSQARVFVVLGVLSRYLCCTVEVCVVFLDTLTPEFELYVRLRERR
ncbi:hypothetical protein Taro_006587 [Colocasia esculenta]|uniref:Pectin acetylesterase n=1 Tax=Colocasia esculenta TaxID=4460 RepID=A0A843TRM7_COLES|nr:hypothetical protein [Colocasia esculenta]